MYLLNFYFLILAIGVCLFGRFLGKKITILANLFFLASSTMVNAFIFYESVLGSVLEIQIFSWIVTSDLVVNFTFFYDFLSSSMLFLVTFISLLVHVYSYSYMDGDPSKVRFFCYLSFFTMFMALLVVSDSLVQLFFAWEGVGISSYLLINFWYTRYEANRAALKAVFVNRFGDFGLYTGIVLFLIYYKTQSISAINCISQTLQESSLNILFLGYSLDGLSFISFFIFLGVVGKSAQLGLHTWLPDAMEGPTPVSALLHAATMVTAGIYLLLRLSFFFQATNLMAFIAFWGALTAFFASTVGAFQNDVKKIIAYSTCSQLGYMLAACGLYNFAGAYFHLFNHAFFKALLFLGAGSIIHAVGDEQDIRKYGGMLKFLPFTHICLAVASVSLMGIPFFSGFYSKDVIVNWSYAFGGLSGRVVYILLIAAAFFTAFYSIKILYYVFYSTPRIAFVHINLIKESSFWMKFPMLLLSFFALISGYLLFDLFVGYGSVLFFDVSLVNNYYVVIEFLAQLRKFAPVFAAYIALVVFILLIISYEEIFQVVLENEWAGFFYTRLLTFLNKKWYFDFFYYFVVKYVVTVGYKVLFKNFDKGLLEKFFVKKTIWSSVQFSNIIRFYQTGSLHDYLIYLTVMVLVLGIVILLMWLKSFVLLILFLFQMAFLICRQK